MDGSAWAIVAATVSGPIAAVLITMWLQQRDRDYQRRLDVFRAMMRMRRHQLSPDWVGSLNLVPVEYSRFPLVIESFNRLLDAYNDTGWVGDDEQKRRASENADVAASQLLLRMAGAIRVGLHGLDLRRAYSPQGWATDEDANRTLRNVATNVLGGRWPLRVVVTEAPDAMPPVVAPPPAPPQQPDTTIS